MNSLLFRNIYAGHAIQLSRYRAEITQAEWAETIPNTWRYETQRETYEAVRHARMWAVGMLVDDLHMSLIQVADLLQCSSNAVANWYRMHLKAMEDPWYIRQYELLSTTCQHKTIHQLTPSLSHVEAA